MGFDSDLMGFIVIEWNMNGIEPLFIVISSVFMVIHFFCDLMEYEWDIPSGND